MRRIFWKILLSFWLAIVVTGLTTGVIVTLYQDAQLARGGVETGDRLAEGNDPRVGPAGRTVGETR